MSNIYRRGHVLWWAKYFSPPNSGSRPIMLRVTLRTGDLHEARTRAAWLETEFSAVLMEVERKLKDRLDLDGYKAVFHEALRNALERYLLKQAKTPWLTEQHVAANARHAQYFALLAELENPPRAGTQLETLLTERGFAEDEIYGIMNTAFAFDERKPAISNRYLAEYLRSAGYDPSVRNMQDAFRVVAAAYREACLEASRKMGAKPAKVDPMPPALAGMMDLVNEAAKEKSPANTALDINQLEGISTEQVRLFVAANGDLYLSKIQQAHLNLTELDPDLWKSISNWCKVIVDPAEARAADTIRGYQGGG